MREPFAQHDEDAGYWISRQAIYPLGVTLLISSLPSAVEARGAELRVIDRRWDIHDDVTASTLSFSISRTRNAC